MLTAKALKEHAKAAGADLVGIAPMERFEGAPKQYDPRYIFPDARVMIVLGFRIPRGSLRGIEEGTFYISYVDIGYTAINAVLQPVVLTDITRYLEDEGYEAVPIANHMPWCAINTHTGQPLRDWSRPVSPEKPAPDVFIHLRLAAVAAGLGEIGYNHLLLTPQFGPRQRLACIITDAPLEPDPLFEGSVCDRCLLCARDCTGGALSTTETDRVVVAGKVCEWGKFDIAKCTQAYRNPPREHNPFLGDPTPQREYGRALEGAKGCIRTCMDHLEKTGRIQHTFKRPFRTRKPWRIDG